METILIIIIAILYCAAGALLELYEVSQTNNKFRLMTILKWPKMLFGK